MFRDFLDELFEPVGGVSFRPMFGGLGIYRQGIMFALVADDVLYLKADSATIPAFEEEGSAPFAYQSRNRSVTMSYWRLPERLFDEPEAFREWALAAFEAALQTQGPAGGKRSQARRRKAKA